LNENGTEAAAITEVSYIWRLSEVRYDESRSPILLCSRSANGRDEFIGTVCDPIDSGLSLKIKRGALERVRSGRIRLKKGDHRRASPELALIGYVYSAAQSTKGD